VKYSATCLFLAAALLSAATLRADEIVTASQFFAKVSEKYGQINDYEGKITIATSRETMQGDIIFKAPSLLRVDFTSPANQVIAFDGKTLTVYIPAYNSILSQTAADKPGAGSTSLATREGLSMLRRNYTVAFEESPAPQPLEGSPGEQAVRLVLNRSSAAEGFKTIKLYISPESLLIRRIEGWTIAGDKLTFNFVGIKTNVGIPAARFIYDSPASANVYNNFLFKSEN